MLTEASHQDFIDRYTTERPLYDAWGRYVTREVSRRLSAVLPPDVPIVEFLKVPAKSRTKTVASLVAKAYYKGKGYTNPYDQITDKVGTRFVVLLLSHVEQVKQALEECADWRFAKDRDFEEERRKHPLLFDYQSVHYIVRCNEGITDGDVVFPEGLPCEVQIRTLMQHAFAELTHDAIYKATGKVPPEVLREVAKSMALIETTDGIFQQVSMSLHVAGAQFDDAILRLSKAYVGLVGETPETDRLANAYLLDQLQELWSATDIANVEHYLAEKVPSVRKWVAEKAPISFLFRQPAVILLYYLADRRRVDLRQQWPLTEQELDPVYADLGYS